MTPNQPSIRSRSAAPHAASSASSSAVPASERKGPVKHFRLGRISAAIWENGTPEKKFYSVTFTRTYVDDAKNFHDSDSFGRDDLPLVEKLADRAHAFIFERLSSAKADAKDPA